MLEGGDDLSPHLHLHPCKLKCKADELQRLAPAFPLNSATSIILREILEEWSRRMMARKQEGSHVSNTQGDTEEGSPSVEGQKDQTHPK